MVATEENILNHSTSEDVADVQHAASHDDLDSAMLSQYLDGSQNNHGSNPPTGGETPLPQLNEVVAKLSSAGNEGVRIPRPPPASPVKSKKEAFRDYVTLAILLVANLINYMDRYTIAGVLEDVQKYYDINNAQSGLLQTSFIISYMLLSPVFGYLGDRYNRKWAMAGGILFWSLVTLAGSFVPPDKFNLFLFLRAMVGVGEASYSTIAPTIIADMFSKSMRTKALSVFYFAIPVGSGLGYIVGAKVASMAGAWYWSLRVTPLLGLLCTMAVMFILVEPVRGASDGGSHLQSTSFMQDLKYLVNHKSFLLSTLGFTCVSFVAGALALWAPLYLYRSARLSDPTVTMESMSFTFGVITCVAGLVGVLGGYWASSRIRKFTAAADPIICAVGLIAGAPFLFFALLFSKDNIHAAWALVFISETLISLNWALVTDILLYTVIPTRRSAAEALQILVSHALGDAGSPYLVGLISDSLESSYDVRGVVVQYVSLQYALYVSCFVCVLGGAFFLFNALFVVKDKRKADTWIRECNVGKNSNNASGTSLIDGNNSQSTDSSTQSSSHSEFLADQLKSRSLLSVDSCQVVVVPKSANLEEGTYL